jgi:hypothetical protein
MLRRLRGALAQKLLKTCLCNGLRTSDERQLMNESARRIDFIDHARGIAILSVFLFHALTASYGFEVSWAGLVRNFRVPLPLTVLFPLNMGGIGVPIFFVVSGFCIHASFYKQGKEWTNFYSPFLSPLSRLHPGIAAVFSHQSRRDSCILVSVYRACLLDPQLHFARVLWSESVILVNCCRSPIIPALSGPARARGQVWTEIDHDFSGSR